MKIMIIKNINILFPPARRFELAAYAAVAASGGRRNKAGWAVVVA